MLLRLTQIVTVCLGLLVALSLSAKTVVVVDSYNADYPWSKTSRHGLSDNMEKDYDVIFHEMDTKRLPDSLYEDKANSIWNQIRAAKPDLVVTMDDNALKYLGERITDSGTPLVFMGVNNDPRIYFKNDKLPERATGVLERPLVLQSILYISKIIPMKYQRMLLLMDNGATSRGVFEKTLDSKDHITYAGVELDVFITDSFTGWKSAINMLSPDDYDAVLIGSFSTLQDHSTPEVTDSYILKWASKHSPIPLFGFWSHRIGHGKTVGGLVIDGYEHGKSAANLVNTVLETDTFPLVEVSKIGEPIFSESQLSRWHIELPSYIRSRSTIVE